MFDDSLSQDASYTLSRDGPFAKDNPDFIERQSQQRMAELFQQALENQEDVVVEAPTGVGKSFAYLVPAIQSGLRLIISTGTKHLQDQLFNKDIPYVKKILNSGCEVALLKGRSNYLCLHRFKAAKQPGVIVNPVLKQQFKKVSDWSKSTKTGDINTASVVEERAPIWPIVTANAEQCVGQDCPDYKQCFMVEARKKAFESDIIVVNHHLLLSDIAIKQEGFGEVLPFADSFIIDEAHQLPEIATRFFGETISGRMLNDLARDITQAQVEEASDMPDIREYALTLEQATREFRLKLEGLDQRGEWPNTFHHVQKELNALHTALKSLFPVLEEASQRGVGLERCYERLQMMSSRLERFNQPEQGRTHWYEYFGRGFSITSSPLDVSQLFQDLRKDKHASWLFTSATLSAANQFDYFTRRLGLEQVTSESLDSPFNYEEQGVLYLPQSMPDPRAPNFLSCLIDSVTSVLRMTKGHAFLLFTSHYALDNAYEKLVEEIDYPLFKQGDASKQDLVEKFKTTPSAVLLGTQSFWEGVDVQGDALKLVVIDKLPFASPSDPIVKARVEMIEREGGVPFFDYQIPEAAITLKQGAGRLIRSMSDVGVLMICDNRLTTKGYGKQFIDSLPPMPIINDEIELKQKIKRLLG